MMLGKGVIYCWLLAEITWPMPRHCYGGLDGFRPHCTALWFIGSPKKKHSIPGLVNPLYFEVTGDGHRRITHKWCMVTAKSVRPISQEFLDQVCLPVFFFSSFHGKDCILFHFSKPNHDGLKVAWCKRTQVYIQLPIKSSRVRHSPLSKCRHKLNRHRSHKSISFSSNSAHRTSAE